MVFRVWVFLEGLSWVFLVQLLHVTASSCTRSRFSRPHPLDAGGPWQEAGPSPAPGLHRRVFCSLSPAELTATHFGGGAALLHKKTTQQQGEEGENPRSRKELIEELIAKSKQEKVRKQTRWGLCHRDTHKTLGDFFSPCVFRLCLTFSVCLIEALIVNRHILSFTMRILLIVCCVSGRGVFWLVGFVF